VAGENSPFDGGAYGRERCAHGALPRHRHRFGYICVVLKGSFLEAGDAGRFRVAAGDVLVHRPFEAHLDRFAPAGADVLNLPLPAELRGAGRFAVQDLDGVARMAERDVGQAARAAAAGWTAADGEGDWPDLLARDLGGGRRLCLARWAAAHGLAPETLSRGFRKAYGTTPARFGAELRARRAWERVRGSDRLLVDLALEEGFADQAHMTRAVSALTGAPPTSWRGRVKTLQDREGGAL
jgi:AraC-like DNA-binding protein